MTTNANPNEVVELLAIQVADLEFALDLGAVKEVIRPPALVRVPGLPPFVSGVINFRGVAIPVIDLTSRFQASPAVSETPQASVAAGKRRLVICAVRSLGQGSDVSASAPRSGDKVVAFEVDGASEIVRVPRGTVLPADGGLRAVVAGVVPHRDRLLVWLDAPGLLSSDEKLTLDAFRMRKEDLLPR
jgi:purine-binding chemotaxis protein CheW